MVRILGSREMKKLEKINKLKRKLEKLEESDSITTLKSEARSLEQKLEKLKLEKKISEEDIKHMVRLKEEMMEIEYKKKEIEIEKIENIIKNISEQDLPSWFFNRPKSRETGKDRHLFGPDLTLQTKSDIDLMKRVRSWKGFRHSNSLKVRGQRTRTTGRRKKGTGVKRKGRNR